MTAASDYKFPVLRLYTDHVLSDPMTYSRFKRSFDTSVNSGAKRDESNEETDLRCKEIITAVLYNV
jgi:hypothetical protein